MVVRRDHKSISNDRVLSFRIGGGDDFKLEWRACAGGHYKASKEERKKGLMDCEE